MKKLQKMFDRLWTKASDRMDYSDFAKDLALAPSELSSLVQARPETRNQLESMAQQYGVTPEEIDEDRWRALEIVQACQSCKSKKGCAQYLAGRNTSFMPEESCPNSEHYLELANMPEDVGQHPALAV